MKFELNNFRYVTDEEIEILKSIEKGTDKYMVVPLNYIEKCLFNTNANISRLTHSNSCFSSGSLYKKLQDFVKKKLILPNSNLKYTKGYSLSYGGYDMLAVNHFVKHGYLGFPMRAVPVGKGKEADVYLLGDIDGNDNIIIKIHRLGRTSFRNINKKRDYVKKSNSLVPLSWTRYSCYSSEIEYKFMIALFECGFRIPRPVTRNRHCILMEFVEGVNLCNLGEVDDPLSLYKNIMNILFRLLCFGLVHSDFNEFNIIVDIKERLDGGLNEYEPVVIDFPQMVSINHQNAFELFCRDYQAVSLYFRRYFKTPSYEIEKLSIIDNSVSFSLEEADVAKDALEIFDLQQAKFVFKTIRSYCESREGLRLDEKLKVTGHTGGYIEERPSYTDESEDSTDCLEETTT